MNLEFIKPQNLDSLLMNSRQSNFNLRSPGSYLVRSYLITTVKTWVQHKNKEADKSTEPTLNRRSQESMAKSLSFPPHT